MERIVREFKIVLIETIDKHCGSVPSTLKYYLLDYTVEDIRRHGTPTVLDIGIFEHYSAYIK